MLNSVPSNFVKNREFPTSVRARRPQLHAYRATGCGYHDIEVATSKHLYDSFSICQLHDTSHDISDSQSQRAEYILVLGEGRPD